MASDPRDNGDMILRSRNLESFTQNGQVDWIAFLRGTAEATISILTRLSGSGVEPLTVLVAQQAFSTIRLSSDGEQNVTTSVSSLRSFGAFGDVVWFGIGVRHLVRSLAQTREGLRCVGICGALAATYSPDISAPIMSAFVDLTGIPREASPSIAQWKRLISACEGSLTCSSFEAAVFEFCSHAGLSSIVEETSDPQEVAEAMNALAKVSSGLLDSIVFSGSLTCGWLGAVAQWLLGLSVVVENESEEVIHHGAFAKKGEKAQIRILYGQPSNQTTSASVVVRKSWRLGKVSHIIRDRYERSLLLLCVRVPWNSALRSTFGKTAVQQLTQDLATAFSTGLGSAACIFELVANASHGVNEEDLKHNVYYHDGSYGHTFLGTVASCFPEVPEEAITQAMNHVSYSYNDACMTYEAAVKRIVAACSCREHPFECRRAAYSDMPDENFREIVCHSLSPVCLLALFDMIVETSRATSIMTLRSDINPSQSGLYNIYQTQLNRLDWKPLARLLHPYMRSQPFQLATTLYCGSCPANLYQERGEKASAIVHRGLCFYLDVLCSIDDPESLLRVNIVPGVIELDNRSHSLVLDAPFEAPKYAPKQTQMIAELPNCLPSFSNELDAVAVATEAESYISFTYKITSPQGSSWIPPAELAIAAATAMGRINCSRGRGCSPIKALPQIQMVYGEGIVPNFHPMQPSTRLRIVSQSGPAWCVALMHALRGDVTIHTATPGQNRRIPYSVLLRNEQCMYCCIRRTMLSNHGELLYMN